MHIDYRLIGSRIKQKRKNLGLTQEKLAERLSVSVGYVSQVERGITKISLDLLGEISTILSCNIAEFITDSAVDGNRYLADELHEKISALDKKDRQLILGILDLMSKQ